MTKVLRDEARELQDRLNKEVEGLSLSDFEKADMSVEIFSEILGRIIWLCSDWEMARQIRADDPDAICYTANELKEIIRLNPSPEFLQLISEGKEVFSNVKVISTETKDELRAALEEQTSSRIQEGKCQRLN